MGMFVKIFSAVIFGFRKTGMLQPVDYLSLGGIKYGLIIVDDYSHFTWVFFLYDKS
jgi:hypothetical protein